MRFIHIPDTEVEFEHIDVEGSVCMSIDVYTVTHEIVRYYTCRMDHYKIDGITCPLACYSTFNREMFKFICSSLHPDEVDCVFTIENEHAVIFFEKHWVFVRVSSHDALVGLTSTSRLDVREYDYHANGYELSFFSAHMLHHKQWACMRVPVEERRSKMLAFMMSTVARLQMKEADDGRTCICHVLDVFLLEQIARMSSLYDDVPAYFICEREMYELYALRQAAALDGV